MLVTERTLSLQLERVSRCPSPTVDVESDGLAPWAGSRVVGAAVEVDGEAAYFAERHKGGGNLPAGTLTKLLHALKGKRLKGFNLRYDLTMLSYEEGGDWCLTAETDDSIVDALLMDENLPSFSLAYVSERYLGAGAADSKRRMDELLEERLPGIRSARARKGNLWELHAAEVADYACFDTLLPARLRERFAPALENWGLTELARQMNAYNLLLARMQKIGIAIDVPRCAALSESTETRKAELLRHVRMEARDPDFNPNSWQQVVRLLKTRNAKESTLARLESVPLARGVIDYKKLGKAKSSYYDAILRLVDADGILHPQLNMTRGPQDDDGGGTKTGRLSCSDPNFQALPRADDDPNAIYKVRDLVVPRPGMKLAKLDYERAEVWMSASYCKEPKLIAAYHAGEDPYVEMSTRLKITRKQAKLLHLMTTYGAGDGQVASKLGWDKARAHDVRMEFFGLYPAIRQSMRAYADAWESRGSLRLWTGRAIHYPGERAYAAANRVFQGAVGEMVRTAQQRLEAPLAELGGRQILQVHDELCLEYPAESEREVIALATRVMTDFDQFLLRPRVEPKVSGTNYAEMQNYNYREAA